MKLFVELTRMAKLKDLNGTLTVILKIFVKLTRMAKLKNFNGTLETWILVFNVLIFEILNQKWSNLLSNEALKNILY